MANIIQPKFGDTGYPRIFNARNPGQPPVFDQTNQPPPLPRNREFRVGTSLWGNPLANGERQEISVDPEALMGERATSQERMLTEYFTGELAKKFNEGLFKERAIQEQKSDVVKSYFANLAKLNALRKARLMYLQGMPSEQIVKMFNLKFDPANLSKFNIPPSLAELADPQGGLPAIIQNAINDVTRRIEVGDIEGIESMILELERTEDVVEGSTSVGGPAPDGGLSRGMEFASGELPGTSEFVPGELPPLPSMGEAMELGLFGEGGRGLPPVPGLPPPLPPARERRVTEREQIRDLISEMMEAPSDPGDVEIPAFEGNPTLQDILQFLHREDPEFVQISAQEQGLIYRTGTRPDFSDEEIAEVLEQMVELEPERFANLVLDFNRESRGRAPRRGRRKKSSSS